MGNNRYTFEPDYVIHPGDYVEELLETYGIKQTELAIRLGITPKHLNNIINAKVSITPDMAQALELVFPHKARYWLSLQMAYDIAVQKQDRKRYCEEHREECEQWLLEFDYASMVTQGYFRCEDDVSSMVGKVNSLLTFFGCADIESWKNLYCSDLPAACRITGAGGAKLGNTSAWLRYGQVLAQKNIANFPPYSREQFKNTLNEIRRLTRDSDDFSGKMKELCKQSGVCLMFVKELPKSGISGAAFWIQNHMIPCIQMNLRYKRNDHFWFTFFHEAVHILKEHKKVVYMDCEKKENTEIEKEADLLAGNILIPEKAYEKFLSSQCFFREDIIRFSDEIGIHPGVVVGRLQHDRQIQWAWHNDLKQTIEWSK